MSAAVTLAPLAAAVSAALPVPQARSTRAASCNRTRRSTASTTSVAITAICAATASYRPDDHSEDDDTPSASHDANTDVGAGSLDDAITKRRSIPETSIPETSMG